MRKQITILLILSCSLAAPACGFRMFGLDFFGKNKYQVAEKMNAKATVQGGLINKTIGENTTNNDTTLMIIINAFLILVILIKEIKNMFRNIRQEKRLNKLIEAIYHSPEMVVKNVKIKEKSK